MGMPFSGLMNRKNQLSKIMKLRGEQKKLAQQTISYQDGDIEIEVSGDFKIKKLVVNGQEEKRLQKALNEALKRAQKVVAKQSQALLGELLGM